MKVDVNQLFTYFRMMGFEPMAWAYSEEQLKDPLIIAEIEKSVIHLMEITKDDAKEFVALLIEYSYSLTNKELEQVRLTSPPSSLPQLLETILHK